MSAGTILATLEGHDSARLQLALAEAQKERSEHERSRSPRRGPQGGGCHQSEAHQGTRTLRPVRRRAQGQGTLRHRDGPVPTRDAGHQERARPGSHTGQGHRRRRRQARGPKRPTGAGPEEAILKGQLDLATAALRETEVRAPGPGRVLRVSRASRRAELGSAVADGRRLLDDRTGRGLPERRAPNPARRPAEVDILGTKVAGKVSRIGSIVGKNLLTSIDPRAMRDLRVIDVTIQLEEAAPADRFVDMEVDAVIRPSGPAPASEPPARRMPIDRPIDGRPTGRGTRRRPR